MLTSFSASLNDYTGKMPFDMDYRLRLKNGEYRWFHAGGGAIHDENGVPLRIAGTIRDVTYEKNKEQALEAMNESLKQLSDSINEMVQDNIREIAEQTNLLGLNASMDEVNSMSESLVDIVKNI